MDVTCQQCKAEYEFDETLLGEKGTTVKCSSCGHVFRVHPPDRDGGRAQLKVRFARDGSTQTLGSLRELQQRIRSGEVSPDDELGREGFPFRRLADVPELRNFFVRSPERTTVRPEASAPGRAAGGFAVEQTPRTIPRPETQLGTAPTARPSAVRTPSMQAGLSESLDSPTLVTARPEAIAAMMDEEARDERVEMRTRAGQPAKRTMLGVGPGAIDASQPVRLSNVASGTLGPAPAMARPHGAGDAPPASERPPVFGKPSGTILGTPSPIHVPAGAIRGPGGPPHAVPPGSAAASAQSDRHPAGPALPPDRELEGRGRLAPPPQAAAARTASPVRLYLEDDEVAPERATHGSSKLWLYVALLGLLAAGGWFGVTRMLGARPSPEQPSVADPSATNETGLAATSPESAEAAPTRAATEAGGAADAALPSAEQTGGPTAGGAPTAAERASKPERTPRPERTSPVEPARRTTAAADSAGEPQSDEDATRGRSRSEKAEPKDYAGWVARGDQLARKGDHEGAAAAYEAALAERPTGSEANSGLGFALLQKGKAREALPHFDQAADSGFAEANIGLGDAYRKLAQPSSAIEAYRTYLERLPSGAKAAYARSWLDKLEGGGQPREGSTPPPSAGGGGSESGYRPAGELVGPAPPPADDAPPAAPPSGDGAQ